MSAPELSIVVPVLNERETVSDLFETLASQQDVDFELLLVDGGSTDGTLDAAETQRSRLPRPMQLFSAPSGRAHQLNFGAGRAGADLLLFLHVDSLLPDPAALRRALDAYRTWREKEPALPLGGHFALEFRRANSPYSFGYYFWEWKARLARPGCTHGDQGLLLDRATFSRVGPFDPNALLAAETLLADRLREAGRLRLLPARLQTSARRFEIEGLAARQTLNALLMNFAAIGWDGYFAAARNIYRLQHDTARLELAPYLQLISAQLDQLEPGERRRLWLATGRYVRSQAWQIPFAIDARRAFRRGLKVDFCRTPCLAFHDRWFDLLTDNRIGYAFAALLTRVWFWQLKRRAIRSRI